MALGYADISLDQIAALTLETYATLLLDSTEALNRNFRVVACDLFQAGARKAELFRAGTKASDVFSAGAIAEEISG